MYITLLYVSAFMFFIAGRKIKRSWLAGVAVTFLASWPFSYETLFHGYKIRNVIEGFIPDFETQKRNIPTLIGALVITMIFAGIFMLLAKLWSGELFRIPGDEIRSRKMAKRIFIAASVIPGVIALYLINFKAIAEAVRDIQGTNYFLVIFNRIGIDFLFNPVLYVNENKELVQEIRIGNTVYAALPFLLSVLCIILINTKVTKYKELSSLTGTKGSRIPAVAMIFSLSGLLTFLTMIQSGYTTWSSHYRLASFSTPFYYSYIYGSYNARTGEFYDQIQFGFCMFIRGVLIAGIVVLLLSLIYMAVRKLIKKHLFSFIFSILLIAASSACIYKMITEIEKFHSIR